MHITFDDDLHIPEVNTIILQIHSNNQKNNPIHTIINMYRRPHHNPTFIQDTQSIINTILENNPKTTITITGDININLLTLTPESPFLHFLLENNLHTTITIPTRYDDKHNTATLIDEY